MRLFYRVFFATLFLVLAIGWFFNDHSRAKPMAFFLGEKCIVVHVSVRHPQTHETLSANAMDIGQWEDFLVKISEKVPLKMRHLWVDQATNDSTELTVGLAAFLVEESKRTCSGFTQIDAVAHAIVRFSKVKRISMRVINPLLQKIVEAHYMVKT